MILRPRRPIWTCDIENWKGIHGSGTLRGSHSTLTQEEQMGVSWDRDWGYQVWEEPQVTMFSFYGEPKCPGFLVWFFEKEVP